MKIATCPALAGMLAACTITGAAQAATTACPEAGFALVENAPSPAARPVRFGDRTIQVRRDALTRTADIIEMTLEEADHTLIRLKFRPEVAERLENATTNHDGLKLAFVADDEALLAVTWQGEYGFGRDGAQVSIADKRRAHALFDQLRRCMPAPKEAGPRG